MSMLRRESTAVLEPPRRARAGETPKRDRRVQSAAVLALAVTVAAGIAFRSYSRSELWIDEALSVNIARLSLGEMFDALRQDGHPPLYYILLHYWMPLVGESDLAVRSLSAVFSVASLPFAWAVGARYGGRRGAATLLVLLASSPFAHRYATEARMYALVMLLVLVGWLALLRALERPSGGRLAAVAFLSGGLLLTHYWSLYLLAAVAGILAWQAWRSASATRRKASRGTLAAVAVGGLIFLPWLPSFVFQAVRTGTPWGEPSRPADAITLSLIDFGGGPYGEARLLGMALLVLALLGVFGRSLSSRYIELDLRVQPRLRKEALVVALTIALGVTAGWTSGSATSPRYLSVVYPLLLLLAAMGILCFSSTATRVSLIGGMVVLGLVGGAYNIVTKRTQAGEMTAAIAAEGTSGDLVAMCPDQLGPAVSRYLPDRLQLEVLTFPEGPSVERVNWIDYAERNRAADPVAFAREIHQRAGDGTIWLAWSGTYRTLEGKCETLAKELGLLRPTASVVVLERKLDEHGWLYRFDP